MPPPAPATPFQTTLQPASFRGVEFIVEENAGEAGKRGDLHEYPKRDIPYAEELGRRARRYQFRAYVLGDDCAQQRDALLAAIEKPGAGLLVLPSAAPVLVQADFMRPIRYRETSDQERRITFELAFVEAGQVLYPGNASDTQAASKEAAANLDAAADSDLQNGTNSVDNSTDRLTSVLKFNAASAQLDNIGSAGLNGDPQPSGLGISIPSPVQEPASPNIGIPVMQGPAGLAFDQSVEFVH